MRRNIIDLTVVLALFALGVARINEVDLTFFGMDKDQVREYFFHIMAGTFFGWSLFAGSSEIMESFRTEKNRAVAVCAVVAPLLFLILAHQTRDTINDGPATIGISLGYLTGYLRGKP